MDRRDVARARLGRVMSAGRRRLAEARDSVRAAQRQFATVREWARVDPAEIGARIDLAIGLAEPPVSPELLPESRLVKRCTRPGSPRGVVCSMAVGPHIGLLSVAVPTLVEYGERHGWDVVVSTESALRQGRAPSWGKLQLIRELLSEYELVWWVDADALIVDGSTDIRSELLPDKDLYLVEHWFPYPHAFAASCGVMLWRRSPWAADLLDELWADADHADEYPWENAAMLDALGYITSPIFMHLHPTEHVRKLQLLPSAWNSVYTDPATRPFVHHHGGDLTFDERRQLMLHDLARVRRGLPPCMDPFTGWETPDDAVGPLLTDSRPALSMSRDDLPTLLNQRGLLGTGVEVGSYAGEFSARLLRRWRGELLVSVDPWLWGSDYIDVSNVDQQEFELLYEATRIRLSRFGERSQIWRLTSAAAAAEVDAGALDFVYIDARHDEASVHEDLELWMPKVRAGGLISGHDYLDGDLPEGRFGVRSAVDAFFAARGLSVHVTGDATFPTWIVEVPLR